MNLRKSNFPSRFSIQFGEIGRLSLLHDQTCLFNFMAPSVTLHLVGAGWAAYIVKPTTGRSNTMSIVHALNQQHYEAQSYGPKLPNQITLRFHQHVFQTMNHPSINCIILTWFHVVNNDSRLTRLVRVKIQWVPYTSCESTSDSYTPDRWKNYRDSWRRHSPLYPPTPKQNRLCEKDSVSPKPTRYWFISKDGVVGGEEPIKAH